MLPALPAEWAYEGWVTIDGVDVTTGRFSDPSTADDFDGFSGDQGGPPWPGEDFLLNAPPGTTFPVDLAGMTTFVTIEPAQDANPGRRRDTRPTVKIAIHSMPNPIAIASS